MGDLREQLLKAKLIDESQARNVKREKRRKRKKQGVKALEHEASEKARAYQEKLKQDAEKNRERADNQRIDLQVKTREQRLTLLIRSNFISGNINGSTRFYFIARSNSIPCLELSSSVADSIKSGRTAIVEKPGTDGEQFVLVPRAIALQLIQEDPGRVRFFNE